MSQENIIPINYHAKNRLPDTIDSKSAISQEMCKMEGEMDEFFTTLGKLDGEQKTNWIKEIKTPLVESDENRRSLKLRYNVRNYTPGEVKVKQHGNVLTVEAKHEETDPKRHVLREYKKSVVLPEGIHGDDLYAETSKDGILTVSVPVEDAQLEYEELIPINDNRIKERKSCSKESVKSRKSSSSASKASRKSSELLVQHAHKGILKKKSSEDFVKSRECSPTAKRNTKGSKECKMCHACTPPARKSSERFSDSN